MSNILLLFSSSQLGGAEKSLSRMALSSDDVNYVIGTIDSEGPLNNWLKKNGSKSIVYGNTNIISLVFKLYQDIKFYSIDIVYVCGLRASLLLRFLLIFFPQTKLIHGVRWNPNSNSRLDKSFRLVETLFSWLVDGWIVNSKVSRETLLSSCKIKKNDVYVIYNGIQLPYSVESASYSKIEILTVANLNHRKGYIEYLNNISKVIGLVPNLKFVFVGRDDMNGAVQKKIIELGLDEYVVYEGFHVDVRDFYKRAKLFVLPSLWGEGCPTSILEAFSYAVPVVANNIDGIPELIDDGHDGFLLDINDSENFIRVIKMLNNYDDLRLMGERGRDKINNMFTIDSCVRNHKNVMNKILKH